MQAGNGLDQPVDGICGDIRITPPITSAAPLNPLVLLYTVAYSNPPVKQVNARNLEARIQAVPVRIGGDQIWCAWICVWELEVPGSSLQG
jgi:hypothetical protein